MKRDPGGFIDGPNLYRYVENRPTLHSDPTGMVHWLAPWVATAIVYVAMDSAYTEWMVNKGTENNREAYQKGLNFINEGAERDLQFFVRLRNGTYPGDVRFMKISPLSARQWVGYASSRSFNFSHLNRGTPQMFEGWKLDDSDPAFCALSIANELIDHRTRDDIQTNRYIYDSIRWIFEEMQDDPNAKTDEFTTELHKAAYQYGRWLRERGVTTLPLPPP